MANIFPLKKPAPAVNPQRAALDANLRAIIDARAKLAPITEKDRAAQADIAAADEAEQRVATLRGEIDQLVADAQYAGAPPPDLSSKHRALDAAESAFKAATAKARAATVLRQRYAADITAIHEETRKYTKDTTKLLWEAAREELANLAPEYQAAERTFRDVARRVFAAAKAADRISLSQSYGQFVASGTIADLHISRPDHPAFVDPTLTPEQAHAQRIEYLRSIDEAADTLVGRLLTHNA
jgi:uncharacterized membrane protein